MGIKLLQLYNNHLTGTLPPTLGCGGSFPNLQVLDVAMNKLSGSLPGGCNHIRGSTGSDSCIVPLEPSHLRLM
jgi:hypothetical protein